MLEINCVRLLIIPVVRKCHFGHVFITTCYLNHFEIIADGIQPLHDTREYTITYFPSNLPQKPLLRDELSQAINQFMQQQTFHVPYLSIKALRYIVGQVVTFTLL